MSHHLIKEIPKQEENIGIEYYTSCGKIFIGCGILSFLLLAFVSTLPQDYEKYNIPLFFGIWALISLCILALGIALILLCKKSKKFQQWAEKDVQKFASRLIEKETQRQKKKQVKQGTHHHAE